MGSTKDNFYFEVLRSFMENGDLAVKRYQCSCRRQAEKKHVAAARRTCRR